MMAGASADRISTVDLRALAIAAGLGIEQVTLVGNRNTPDAAIFDTMDLPNNRTQFDLDTQAVKARIERLPWIASASVTRVLPDGLTIEVRERKPAVVWQHEGREWLVDRSGRVLGPNPAGERKSLYRVAGMGAADATPELVEIIAKFPDLGTRLAVAERISDRRWTLHLANGSRLLLPAGQIDEAVSRAFDGKPGARLIDRAGAVIDLRVPLRLAIGVAG